MAPSIDLAFLVPVAHPRHILNPQARTQLLRRSIASMLRQATGTTAVYVVSNEPLPAWVAAPDVSNLVVPNFGPASANVRPTWEELWRDKGCKLFLAASQARADGARVVMAVDSDDVVSNRLGGFVTMNAGDGWYSDEGYIHLDGSRWAVHVRREFHLQNGSTQLLSVDGLRLDESIDLAATAKDVLVRAGEETVVNLFGAHRRTASFMAGIGKRLDRLPFPATIWEVGTGSNYTNVLKAKGCRVPLAGRLSEEFGIEVPSRARHVSSQGRALAQRVSLKLARWGDRHS